MDSRTLLLKTALNLFAQRGYDSVGVQEIVATAELTKPSLYHHFGSKHGLLDDLLTEGSAPLIEALRTASAYDGNLDATLERVLDAYLGFAETAPDFYRFWLSLLFCPPGHEAYRLAVSLFSAQSALLERMFLRAAEDHGNMKGRHVRYAYVFISVINSVVAANTGGETHIEADQRREILHQFSHGIYS